MKTPILVLNFKAYREASGKKAVKLAGICDRIAKKYRISIAVCPQFQDLKEISSRFKNVLVFSQHVDPIESAGPFTGHVVAENLKTFIKGSLINHSEKKLNLEEVERCVRIMKKLNLFSLCCASSPLEAWKIAKFSPDGIAVEPPELIGTGVSVSNAKPEIITKSLRLVKKVNRKIKVLCGAGISTPEDVEEALKLGAEGVLIASAFVKSKNPKNFLEKIARKI